MKSSLSWEGRSGAEVRHGCCSVEPVLALSGPGLSVADGAAAPLWRDRPGGTGRA